MFGKKTANGHSEEKDLQLLMQAMDGVIGGNYEDIDIRISNSLILGFRKLEGINVKEFNKKYNVDILSLYNIKELLNSGELELSDNYLKKRILLASI